MKRTFITVLLCVVCVVLISFSAVATAAVGEGDDLNASSKDELLAEEDLSYYEQDVQDDAEHFDDGKVVKMSGLIYRFIWIPILLAVCSVAGLIYVNVAYKSYISEIGKGK